MPNAIDHLLFAGPDLDELARHVTAESGVEPVPGGRHRGQGTHNAIVGLGAGRYLELMALDPAGDEGGPGAFGRSLAYLAGPALHTWCARVHDAAAFTRQARAAGLRVKEIAGGRTRPDGAQLRWTLLAVRGHQFGGLVPFFIDWRDSAHPSADLPAELRLNRLTLAHPDPAGLTRLLAALGGPVPDVRVQQGARPGIAARLSGPRGEFVLSGTSGVMDFG